ncbi:MAG TPA: IPT/TIG domain-containing protein [Bryobacteraceae bacterium]|nr:IPT/TIG domain-containing protein [Bryobacteraceae bacterium]
MRYILVLSLFVSAGMGQEFIAGQAARAVVGQPYFTASFPGASQTLIGAASGVAYANNTLFIADSNRAGATPTNNRVLIYRNLSSQFPEPSIQPPNQGVRCPVCGGIANVVLGQPNFSDTDANTSNSGMFLPTSVATDGKVLVVADTNNNRVLIWNSIPTTNHAPANVVIGQNDFTSGSTLVPPTAKSLRGPQGVWIQDGKLYLADTQNNRILVYNSIPTSNGASADLVLGQPNFTTAVQQDLTQAQAATAANNMLNPVAVTSDGTRLYVADLGYHRVLIWNTIPTQNQQPADVAVGQVDLVTSIPDNAFSGAPATTAGSTSVETPVMCTVSNGTDSNSKPTYPDICASTLSFPRYALSDGTRLFIADGGNDRVLIFNHIPTKNGEPADLVLGQPDMITDTSSNDTDSLATPTSLAFDGTNLYVSDTYNQRVMIYTEAAVNLPVTAVKNAASLEIYAEGTITLAGTLQANDSVTITIEGKNYVYKEVNKDTFANIVSTLVNAINAGAGDPNVIGVADTQAQQILLVSRTPSTAGNNITYSATVSTSATITVSTGGATLTGGGNAAQIGPGSLITLNGTGLSDSIASDPGTGKFSPTQLAGTQVFIDGSPAPLLYVSPTQINAQMPLFAANSASVSLYVRTEHADGTTTASISVPVQIVPENPGIFAGSGAEPRPAMAFHGSQYANALVSVDGSVKAGDIGTVKISDRSYNYTVLSTDTLTTVTQALANLVDKDPQVHAFPAAVFTRLVLQARKAGKAGVGITFSASVNTGANLLLTAIGVTSGSSLILCCPNTGPIKGSNPAVPGETITIYATGLGDLASPNPGYASGRRYDGPVAQPASFLSSLAGGKTANVLEATPMPGSVGVWVVQLQLDSGLTTDKDTQLTIAQDIYVSNVVRFPVKAP